MSSLPDTLRPAAPAGPLVFAFNGDADGLCAQHILALEEGLPATRVTGWKRDIQLLARLPELPRGARLRVFDISLDANRDALPPLLHREDIDIVWYDHHEPGEPPAHPRLRLHVNMAPGLCSAVIVDQVHGFKHRDWAALGAYGDNLPTVAEGLLRNLGIPPSGWPALERAGVLLNYNAYGDRPGDVLFEPSDLAPRMEPFASAAAFAAERSVFDALAAQHDSDRDRFQGLSPLVAGPKAKAFLVPDEPWARRYAASWANARVRAVPEEALATLHPRADGTYLVSLRSPRLPGAASPAASDLAREFPTGGGRKLAAGINALPAAELESFLARFLAHYR